MAAPRPAAPATGRFALPDPAGWPLVMGIVNVTPDSFSDGGRHLDPEIAADAALRMEAEGAAIIDVGGESTRPGSDLVPAAEERRRVVPVIERIRAGSRIPISIDTRKAEVARAALDAGADIVNDVSAMQYDPEMAGLVRETGAAVILMHMRGDPKTMQKAIHFDDVVREVHGELAARKEAALAAGIDPGRIVVDPGIGFGKTFEQNLELLRAIASFRDLAPVLVGASRKAFIGHLTGKAAGAPRMAGSLAAVGAAALGGASIVRVHDVAETVDFLRVFSRLGGNAR